MVVASFCHPMGVFPGRLSCQFPERRRMAVAEGAGNFGIKQMPVLQQQTVVLLQLAGHRLAKQRRKMSFMPTSNFSTVLDRRDRTGVGFCGSRFR